MIPTLSAALEAQGYATLTPVQEAVTADGLEDKDLLVSAQTGSGKTVGFGLAIGPTILPPDGVFGPAATPLALIIAPTRELALQVKRELQWLYKLANVTVASTVGGMDFRDERRALDRGAHVVVATPGRLRDHIMRGTIDLSAIRAVVLDEADEMLDLGFREDLEFILGEAPAERRTLLFSATVPPMIAKLAKSYQKDAMRISTVTKETQHADITYRALPVAQHDAENAIINVLRFYDAPNAIVFANTRAMVTRLTTRLSNRGFATVALSGELSQQERTHALQAMRDGRARVCVATDVAARGIDLPNLDLVIHAELPTNAETLLHRSGRTGRAGRKGISAMIVPPKMRRRAENLLKWGKLSADWAAAPSAEEILAQDEERMLADPMWAEEPSEAEGTFAAKILELHSPEKIAAAYFKLYQAKNSAPEDLTSVDPSTPVTREPRERKERAPFGPSKWFSVDIGRNAKAEARWLLPMICKAGGITKKEIGAIRIQPDETYVEISEAAVPGFLRDLGPDMSLENQGTLTALDGPPQISERGPRPSKKMYRDKPDGGASKPRPHRKDDGPSKPRPNRTEDGPSKPRAYKQDGKSGGPKGGKKRDDAAFSPRKPRQDSRDTETISGSDAVSPLKSRHKKSEFAKPSGPRKDAKPYTSDSKDKPYKAKGPKGKPASKDAKKPKGSASDTSKRFTPPGGKARPAKRGKGGSATPRRSKT